MNPRTSRWLLPWLAAAACTTRPQDPFVFAERAAARRDLAGALQALDGVPVEHVRYPAARAMALDVERQMRRGHELILEGLMLRAEWRDDEALAVLQRAATVWPELPGLAVLVRATEQRLRVLGGVSSTPATGADAVAVPPMPLFEVLPGGGAVPAVEVATQRSPEPVPPSPAPIARSTRLPTAADPVSAGLVAVEQRLAANQLEEAVLQLLELSRRFPDDTRVRVRLSRLLHQRALLRYGRGELAPAIADWRRVVELDPANQAAKAMLAAAEAESLGSRH